MSKHTRSLEAEERRLQRREARKIVQRFAFQDVKIAETINMLTAERLAAELAPMFPEGVIYHFAARYERGEVLTDSRGTGSIQH